MKKSHPIVLEIKTMNAMAVAPASVAPQFGQRRKNRRNGTNLIAPSSDPPYALGQSVPPALSVSWYAFPLTPYISAASRLNALMKSDLEENSRKRAATVSPAMPMKNVHR